MRYFVMAGAVLGFLTLLAAIFSGGSAPQQAALAAIACGLAVVPYVGFRVYQLEEAALQNKVFFTQMQKRLEELVEANSKTQ